MAKRKIYQRRINKVVRAINRNIANDWLWNARFTIRQLHSEFHPYEDHSGAEFDFILECTDHKTGHTETKWFNNYDAPHNISRWVNDCIVEYFNVWEEKPNPYEQAHAAGREAPPLC